MRLFRFGGAGILVAALLCSGLLPAGVPAGAYAGDLGGTLIAASSGRRSPSILLSATAFTVQDSVGGRHLVAAAMRMRTQDDAERVCRHIPVIRDQFVSLAAKGKIAVTEGDVTIDESALDRLFRDLNVMLDGNGPRDIFLYDGAHPERLPENMTQMMRCHGGALTGY